MKINFKFLTALVFCLIFLLSLSPLNQKDIIKFNQNLKNYNAKLNIIDKNGQNIAKFLVAIADSDKKRSYGLMNLEKLKDNYGMIFLFNESRVVKMWMKNTKIPLDMLFIDKNNIIVNIHINSKPYSLEIISSEKKADKVLEINAGLVKKLNIKIGQKIELK